MNKEQREKFKRAGWKLGCVGELLDLTRAEEALIKASVQLIKRRLLARRHERDGSSPTIAEARNARSLLQTRI
jgi:hypothetical protein